MLFFVDCRTPTGIQCQFPFTYKGLDNETREYSTCTTAWTVKGKDRPWWSVNGYFWCYTDQETGLRGTCESETCPGCSNKYNTNYDKKFI